MLIRADELYDYSIIGNDEKLGSVKDLFFDDQHWIIRYLTLKNESWHFNREVLISPYAITAVDRVKKIITTNLSKDKILKGPFLQSELPINQSFESDYYDYYELPAYFNGPYMWGYYPDLLNYRESWRESSDVTKRWYPNLHKIVDLKKSSILATDGEIGHLNDIIINCQNWDISHLIVDTGENHFGKSVLFSKQSVEYYNWSNHTISLNISKNIIEEMPEYSAEKVKLLDHDIGLNQRYDYKGHIIDVNLSSEHVFLK